MSNFLNCLGKSVSQTKEESKVWEIHMCYIVLQSMTLNLQVWKDLDTSATYHVLVNKIIMNTQQRSNKYTSF